MRDADGRRDERRTMRLFVACYPSPEAVAELEASLAPVRDRWPALRWTPAEQWHVTLAFYGEVAVDRVDALVERVGRAAERCPPLALRLTRFGAFPSARRARACWVAVEAAGAPVGDDTCHGAASGDGAGGPQTYGHPNRAGAARAEPSVGDMAGDAAGDMAGDAAGGAAEDAAGDQAGDDASQGGAASGDAIDDVVELRHLAARCVAAGRRIGVGGDDAGKPYRPHVTVARPRRPPLDVAPLVADTADHAGPSWVAHEIRLVRSHIGGQVRHEPLTTLVLRQRR